MTESDPQAVEDAVRYIIFLVDPDKLFDIALGMYDFSLVLLIAQNSQKVESNLTNFFTQLSAEKDPREYLPFLRELWSFEESYRHYRINDHLKRYPSALKSLREGGETLRHESKPIVQISHYREQVFRGGDEIHREASTIQERSPAMEGLSTGIYRASPTAIRKPSLMAIQVLMELYGDWLFDRREFKDAGLGW